LARFLVRVAKSEDAGILDPGHFCSGIRTFLSENSESGNESPEIARHRNRISNDPDKEVNCPDNDHKKSLYSGNLVE